METPGNRLNFNRERAQGTQSVAYAANELNQYTNITIGGASSPSEPSCDFDGNLTSDGVNTNYWTAENRLWCVVPLAPTNGSVDVVSDYDERPRTVTEKIKGVITKKSFYAYTINGEGAMVNIEETCLSQNSSYGDSGNLRKVTTFYGPDDGQLLNGRIKTIPKPY